MKCTTLKNLQDLYDFYRQTNPSHGKIKAATTFLIHCCKALNLSSPDDITVDIYEDIPPSIEMLFKYSESQSIQDKSILAEMIGRYGPKDGWEKVLEILLSDSDENLKQFTLQSLEYYGCENPKEIYQYVERYLFSDDSLMVHIAARIFISMLCTAHSEFIQKKVKEIVEQGRVDVIHALKTNLNTVIEQRHDAENKSLCRTYYDWLDKNSPQVG